MGISQNNVCKLCNENEETLVHLFTLCNPVKNFWEDLARRVKTDINRDFCSIWKEKTPQVVVALEMLKKFNSNRSMCQEYRTMKVNFKKVGIYSTNITVTYLCNIRIL